MNVASLLTRLLTELESAVQAGYQPNLLDVREAQRLHNQLAPQTVAHQLRMVFDDWLTDTGYREDHPNEHLRYPLSQFEERAYKSGTDESTFYAGWAAAKRRFFFSTHQPKEIVEHEQQRLRD